ncbi:GDSL-type esterase/lipase family protein [Roseomonas sp. CAU 1739]|uniref:SGNH/GDSL hydrolase family protein n=1 Tax=Roseomonas sp. CAU 1739 TaxID=3140364 RepID=UPI00325B9796
MARKGQGPLRFLHALALALTLPLAPAFAASCPTQPQPPIVSAGLADALLRPGGVRIVALGSSSTAGSGASDAAHAYPALLEARLRAALGPGITVFNRGQGGEDADNMLERIGRDAIAERPDLVIWQLGANAAMRQMDPDRFARFVRQGVGQLRQAGIDVVLMDNQRAPRITAHPGNRRFDAILAEIATSTPGVTLFSRGRLMDGWAAAGVPAEALLVSDGLHHNDRGYACVADALADALLAGLPIRSARMP